MVRRLNARRTNPALAFGFVFDATVNGPTPVFALVSPDGSVWEISIDKLGILTTIKRSLQS